jgi:hypothetical protein
MVFGRKLLNSLFFTRCSREQKYEQFCRLIFLAISFNLQDTYKRQTKQASIFRKSFLISPFKRASHQVIFL